MTNNLIISNEPIEEFNDFLNQSLSENNFTLNIFPTSNPRGRQNIEEAKSQPPPPSKEQGDENFYFNEILNTNPLSPNQQRAEDNETFIHNHNEGTQVNIFNDRRRLEVQIPQQDLNSPRIDHRSQKRNTQNSLSPCQTEIAIGQNLIQFIYLKKFMNRMLQRRHNFSLIKPYHLGLLNDKASYYTDKIFGQTGTGFKQLALKRIIPHKKNNHLETISMIRLKIWHFFDKILQKLAAFQRQIPLIYPESKGKVVWDTILCGIRLYFMFVIPIQLAFPQELLYSSLLMVTLLFTCVLVIDVIISFYTPYYEFGQIVSDRVKMFKNTIQKSAGLETLSVVYLLIRIQLTSTWSDLPLLLFFIQYKNITRIMRLMEEVLNLSKPQSSLLELAKLIFTLMYVLHLFTCLWFYVIPKHLIILKAGLYSQENLGKSWLIANHRQLDVASWQEQYLYSFYFSTVTMFTIGYGDITPQSDLEIIVCIFFLMICSIQLSYSVNTVGTIINKISEYSDYKMKKLRILNTYMHKKKISYALQYQIREYLNYFWESKQIEETIEEKDIIDQLSEVLREKLMVEANSIILNGCPLFDKTFSSELKQRVVKKIKQAVIQPENVINLSKFNSSEYLNNQFLCFIEKGQVEIILNNDEGLKIVNEGQSFGIQGFLTGIPSKERFRSLGFTKLLMLSRDDFLKALLDFPEDREKFCMLKDDLLHYGGQLAHKQLALNCFGCNMISHKVFDCPVLHYVPDRERVIKSHQFSVSQHRNSNFIRNTRDRNVFYAIHDQGLIQEVAEFIQSDFWKETLFYDLEETEDNHKVELIRNKSSSNTFLQMSKASRSAKSVLLPLHSIDEDQPKESKQNDFVEIRKKNRQRTIQRYSVPDYTQGLTQASLKLLRSPTSASIESQQQTLEGSPFSNEQQQQSQQLNDTQLEIIKENQENKSILKSVLKKGGSLSSDTNPEKKLKKIKIKFQKALDFVKRMNQIKRTKQWSKKNQILQQETPNIDNRTLQQQNEVKESLTLLKKRILKIQHLNNHSDISQVEYLNLRLSMLDSQYWEAFAFDHLKTYKHYFINNNLQGVVQLPEESHQLNYDFSKLIQYLFFPNLFIRLYKTKQVEPHLQLVEIQEKPSKERETLGKKLRAYKDILKVRNKAREIIKNRHTNKITPHQQI